MRRLNRDQLICIVATLWLAAGCSGGTERPATAPVVGQVLYQGKPVPGATIAFIAEGAPRFGGGQTDDNGKFVISTFGQADGAVLGHHVVTVTKPAGPAPDVPSDEQLSPEERSRAIDQAMERAFRSGPTRSELPEKYADRATSDLRAEVVAGNNEFTFELVD